MAKRLLQDEVKADLRESKYSIDELIDWCSRKHIDENGTLAADVFEITLCLANEIKKNRVAIEVLKSAIVSGLKPDEINGVFLALEQMKVKGKATPEEKRRIKPPPPEPPLPRTIKGCKRPNSKK